MNVQELLNNSERRVVVLERICIQQEQEVKSTRELLVKQKAEIEKIRKFNAYLTKELEKAVKDTESSICYRIKKILGRSK
jgi:uncharacterized coiled-coil protein SlyX